MKRPVVVYGIPAFLAFVLAWYCYSGIAMNASLSVAAGTTEGYDRAVVVFFAGWIFFLVLSVILAGTAWWKSRSA